jgi:hypothetical protein
MTFRHPVIPAKAGIQDRKIGAVALDPRLRGGDVVLSDIYRRP